MSCLIAVAQGGSAPEGAYTLLSEFQSQVVGREMQSFPSRSMLHRPGIVLADAARVTCPADVLILQMVRHVPVVQDSVDGECRKRHIGRELRVIERPTGGAIDVDAERRVPLNHSPAQGGIARLVGRPCHKAAPAASVMPHRVDGIRAHGIGVVALCHLQRPESAVVERDDGCTFVINAQQVLYGHAPAVDVRMQVIDGQVIKQRETFQLTYYNRIVAFL